MRIRLFLVALMALLVGAVNAQPTCPSGLEGDNCTLYQTALVNTATAQSFTMDFEIDLSFDITMMTISLTAEGSGPLVLDGEGNIIAARLDMPEAAVNMGFMGGSSEGAASFILVDEVIFFGMGEDLDSLTWESVTVEELGGREAIDLTVSGMASVDFAAEFGMGTDVPETAEWTRTDDATTPDGETAIQLSSVITGGDLMAGMDEAMEEMDEMEGMGDMGALFGGMAGTFDVDNNLFIDPESNRLIAASILSTISMDMSGMMEGMEETEGMEGMGDLFGDMGGTTTVAVAFSGFDESYDIQAPADAEPMDEMTISAINFGALPDLMSNYFTNAVTMSGGMGGDMGMGGMFGGDSMFFDNCTTTGYTPADAGTLSIGDAVTDALAAGDTDLWTFNGEAGQIVTISMSSDPVDTYLELFGPDGEGLTYNDDFEGFNSQITSFELPASGEYTIAACGYSTFDEGEYNLELSDS
jgi:hypothetical protein